jgi:hypothetical protein
MYFVQCFLYSNLDVFCTVFFVFKLGCILYSVFFVFKLGCILYSVYCIQIWMYFVQCLLYSNLGSCCEKTARVPEEK